MAVSPLNNPLAAALGSLGRPVGPAGNGAAQRPGAAGTQPAAVQRPAARAEAAGLRPQQPLAGAQATAGALPSEAPAGTDPALWSVLTGEERAFFARAAASGPLTYGRISAGVNALQGNPLGSLTSPAARGGRLDVRG
jgi:hypothetical protein